MWIRALRAAALLLLLAQAGWSREAAREDFERGVPEHAKAGVTAGKGGQGKGWSHVDADPTRPAFVDVPVSLDNTVRSGAISFDLQRKEGQDSAKYGTVFGLQDASGRNLLLFQVRWESEVDPRFPAFAFGDHDYWFDGVGLWSPYVLGDREVAPGQWVHLDITWDDANRRYNLYMDGRPLDTRPKWYEPHAGGIVPDPREERKGSPEFRSMPFGFLLQKTGRIRLGVNFHSPSPNLASTPLSNAVLANFVVLADEFPKGLAGNTIVSISDDTFRIPGISGKLVAGDKVSVTLVAAPGGKASFDMGRVKGVPLEEIPPREAAPGSPAVAAGTYQGSYTIRPGDDYENGQIVGRFVPADNVAVEPVASASKWTIETKPGVTFVIDKNDLPADSSAKARIKLVAKDANGNPVKGRRLKLTLATTDQYTGTVGAGDFGKHVGGSLETRWRGETDAFGEVEFDYTSGFAAKTVILTCKDLDSGGVAVEYLTAYKEASIDIALKKVVSRAAVRRSVQYLLKMEATRTELTADGRSRSVIRATLLDPNGTTVPGDPIVFALSSPNGSLRTIQGTTDSSGVATAEYTAGKKVGIVVITATATLRNAQGQVSIILLADAPAKIILAAKPESLPADGMSRADIRVKVTDINDNPNQDTKVEFRVTKGGGALEHPDRQTDRFGDASNRYTAGTEAGIATILATVRSRVPTDAELARARQILFAPYSPDGEDIRIQRWLKKKGDVVVYGESVLEYTVGRGDRVYSLTAPYDCRIEFLHVETWDRVQTGDTLAQISPVSIPGSTAPAPPAQAPRRR